MCFFVCTLCSCTNGQAESEKTKIVFSAVKQSGLVANGINEMANGQDVFSKTMILAVFPELYAILAFACAFLALP